MDIRVAGLVGTGITVVVVIVAALLGQNFLGAKVIGQGSGTQRVARGETVTVAFTTNAAIPAVHIELCSQAAATIGECTVLVRRTTGRSANVVIPHMATSGKATIVVTSYTVGGGLGSEQVRQGIVITK